MPPISWQPMESSHSHQPEDLPATPNRTHRQWNHPCAPTGSGPCALLKQAVQKANWFLTDHSREEPCKAAVSCLDAQPMPPIQLKGTHCCKSLNSHHPSATPPPSPHKECGPTLPVDIGKIWFISWRSPLHRIPNARAVIFRSQSPV